MATTGLKVKVEPGEDVKVSYDQMGEDVVKIMVFAGDLDYFQASIKFVNVITGAVDTTQQSLARQKLWAWMAKSLFGPKATPGPYHYLLDEVEHYDVAALYRQLTRVIDTPTIVSQADDITAIFSL